MTRRREWKVEGPHLTGWKVFPRCATRGRARAPLQLPVHDLLFDERETLRPLGNVCVNRAQGGGVDGTVEADDEIRLVAAVAGG